MVMLYRGSQTHSSFVDDVLTKQKNFGMKYFVGDFRSSHELNQLRKLENTKSQFTFLGPLPTLSCIIFPCSQCSTSSEKIKASTFFLIFLGYNKSIFGPASKVK